MTLNFSFRAKLWLLLASPLPLFEKLTPEGWKGEQKHHVGPEHLQGNRHSVPDPGRKLMFGTGTGASQVLGVCLVENTEDQYLTGGRVA